MSFLELLAPAGNIEALDAAFDEGADAVYLGLKTFNARLRSTNFAYSQFEAALKTARRSGKKIYVTVNTVFQQREADRLYQLLKYLAAVGPDALIVQDFGIVKIVREHFPALKLHASTQMNISSARGANFLSKQGISRVVLGRELSFESIKKIKENTNIELELFCHGALCVSVSGLCLFSSYLGGKSANRGMCTQACRRLYRTDENDSGGYYFSPFDLQLLNKVPFLASAGIACLKIEGRMKSAEYVGTVVRAYRKVIDSVKDNFDIEKSIAQASAILQGDFARKKTIYYFDVAHNAFTETLTETIINPQSDGGTGIKLGAITRVRGAPGRREALVDCSAYTPRVADTIRLHNARDSARVSFKLTSVDVIDNKSGVSCWISMPDGFDMEDIVYIIQIKNSSRRYAQFIKNNAVYSKRQPGHDKAPSIQYQFKKNNLKNGTPHKRFFEPFKEGIYTAISHIEDMYIAQSIRTEGLILQLNAKTIKQIKNEKKLLPFKPQETILQLDPYCPQYEEELLCDVLDQFIEMGYNRFVINNLSHISLFKNTNAYLIAGPYLYMFNRFSAAFFYDAGFSYFVSPYENNRQNLERTWQEGERHNIFVPVFAYPPLFKISGELNWGFQKFYDKNGEQFHLINEGGRSAVFADKPFSIVDKIPFLKQAGFRHFIIDFSGPPLNKQDYKAVISSAHNARPLAGACRFNWKNGFFEVQENTNNN